MHPNLSVFITAGKILLGLVLLYLIPTAIGELGVWYQNKSNEAKERAKKLKQEQADRRARQFLPENVEQLRQRFSRVSAQDLTSVQRDELWKKEFSGKWIRWHGLIKDISASSIYVDFGGGYNDGRPVSFTSDFLSDEEKLKMKKDTPVIAVAPIGWFEVSRNSFELIAVDGKTLPRPVRSDR